MRPPHSIDDHPTNGPARPEGSPGAGPRALNRMFVLTDMPVWLMLLLVALGLPRTVLADLGIVAPESSLLYYVLALAPFATWLAVAVFRESRKPFADFVVLGVLYGLSLAVVHQALWNAGPSLGHRPPAAVRFAEAFSPEFHDLAVRGYTITVALGIGLGTGLVAAVVTVVARTVRSRRRRRSASPSREV